MNRAAYTELIMSGINDYRPQPFSAQPYFATYNVGQDSIIVRDKNSKVLGAFELTHQPWKDQVSDIFFELKQLES